MQLAIYLVILTNIWSLGTGVRKPQKAKDPARGIEANPLEMAVPLQIGEGEVSRLGDLLLESVGIVGHWGGSIG